MQIEDRSDKPVICPALGVSPCSLDSDILEVTLVYNGKVNNITRFGSKMHSGRFVLVSESEYFFRDVQAVLSALAEEK